MNEDNIKPILEKNKANITDSWQTLHIFKGIKAMCYYYTFKVKNKLYCVSGDGYSYVLTDEKIKYYYMGNNVKELEKTIIKVLK